MTLRQRSFEKIMGKRENAGNRHFLLFPLCLLPVSKQISAIVFNLDQSKILSFGKD